jgi:hypothetical protein
VSVRCSSPWECSCCTLDRSCDSYCETVHSITSLYTRLVLRTLDRFFVRSILLGVRCTFGRTSKIVEVRAAGLVLPVAVGVRWDSLLVVTYHSCGRFTRRDCCSSLLLTLLLPQHLPSALAGGPCCSSCCSSHSCARSSLYSC